MGGTKGVHHEHVAEIGHAARQGFVVGLFAHVEAHVLAHHDLALAHLDAVEPVLGERNIATQQLGQIAGHRRETVLVVRLAFLRATEVRHDHDAGAGIERGADCRHRRLEAAGRTDLPVDERHVQILTDQHTLAGEIHVFHLEHGGHVALLGCSCRRSGWISRPWPAPARCRACGWRSPIRCRTRHRS